MTNWKGFERMRLWLGRTEENREKLHSGWPVSRARFELNAPEYKFRAVPLHQLARYEILIFNSGGQKMFRVYGTENYTVSQAG
jgi:hypothetical protein